MIISIILVRPAFIRPVLKLSSLFSWYSDNVGRQVTHILPELISRQLSRFISDGRNSWYASGFVDSNLPYCDVFFTNLTQIGPGATNLFMLKDFFVSKVIFAELAVDMPSSTTGLMNLPLFLGKRQRAVPALFFGVKLFLLKLRIYVMNFLVINVIHLMADGTFFNVPSAISLMEIDFLLWKKLETVLA